MTKMRRDRDLLPAELRELREQTEELSKAVGEAAAELQHTLEEATHGAR